MSRSIDKEALVTAIKQSQELSDEQKADILELISTKKKYGLVWEDSKEDAFEELKTKLPILREIENRRILNDTDSEHFPNHILIEGENLQALVALTYTHSGMIDVIYIDPPYNTGAKNWRYNNDYIDSEDGYRHSKFISFIRHRFEIAKTLLSEKGIIICAIDDYEEHNVRHIMDDVFGEDNRLGTVTVIHNPRGRNDDSFIATMHEYYLFYAKDAAFAEVGYFPMSEKDINLNNS
jgi:adenine-specific DNA-methyltransferase